MPKGKVIQAITLDRAIKHDVDIAVENEITIIKYANGVKEAIPVDVNAIHLSWGLMEKNVPTYIKAGNTFLQITEEKFERTKGFSAAEVAAYCDTSIIVRGILGFWQSQQENKMGGLGMILAVGALLFIGYIVVTQLNIPIPFLTDISQVTTVASPIAP
jgi:hypothetical protein